MGTKENKSTKIILTVLISLLVLVIAVTAFVLVSGKMKADNYTAAIKEAEKYLAENNYEQAIIQYRNAIAIDPKQEDAYLALADIYLEQENISKARAVLKKGYDVTGSKKLKRRLSLIENQTLETKVAEAAEEAAEEIDLSTASQDIAWDTSFVQKIINYTFDDYKNEFGQVVSAETDEEGYLEIRHEKLNAICYYRNTSDNNEIVDGTKKLPYASAMPEKITLDSLSMLFRNFEGGVSLTRMQLLLGERVEPKLQNELSYIESQEENLIVRFGTDSAGNIVSPSAWNELVLPLANKKKAEDNTMEGVVVDAVTGKGVVNAELTFELKNSSGQDVKETTDSRGAFRAELEAGEYEITVKASGYISETFTFTVEKGRSYSGVQFVISPELSGEARIVLEWNAEPRDLDSHLTGSTDSGKDIHVFFGNKKESSGSSVIAELDLDDTDGYGPETTTIHDLNGVYTFTVKDFTGSGRMAQNGATVKIYLPGQSPVVVELDNASTSVDNIWTVCRIDHGQLEVVNTAGTNSGF